MPAFLSCPLCGGPLKWGRLGSASDVAQAECQQGMNVSRRITRGMPCLWRGSHVLVNKTRPIQWADRDGNPTEAPLATFRPEELWNRLHDRENTWLCAAAFGWELVWAEGGWELRYGQTPWLHGKVAKRTLQPPDEEQGDEGHPPLAWALTVIAAEIG